MSVQRRWGAPIAAVLAIALAACAPPDAAVGPTVSPSEPPPLDLLYLAPGPPATRAFLPAFRGAEVALAVAGSEGAVATVTWVEVPEDLAGWEPPDADGAIVAPGTPAVVVARLATLLDVPTVSLAGGEGGPSWRAIAADAAAIAAAMLAEGGDAPCLVVGPDGHAFADEFRASVVGTAPARLRAGAVLREPSEVAGCSSVVWPGAGATGAELRGRLVTAGYGAIPFLASDRLRDGDFEGAVVGDRPGALVVSGAVDVATLLDLRSRRFVQDYQALVGAPPGPFSAEGWDAATLLLGAIREGWPSVFVGVGRRYDLVDAAAPPVISYGLTRAGWRAR